MIYVPFDWEVSFAYTIVPNKHEISTKNEAIILEYFEEQFLIIEKQYLNKEKIGIDRHKYIAFFLEGEGL